MVPDGSVRVEEMENEHVPTPGSPVSASLRVDGGHLGTEPMYLMLVHCRVTET